MWRRATAILDGTQVWACRVGPGGDLPPGIDVTNADGVLTLIVNGKPVRIRPGDWIISKKRGDARPFADFEDRYRVEQGSEAMVPCYEEEKQPLIFLNAIFETGGIRGVVYRFQKGKGLPRHVHFDPENNHITIVARGSLRCTGRPSIEGRAIHAGDVLDWALGEPHGFVALEDDTVIVQIRKHK